MESDGIFCIFWRDWNALTVPWKFPSCWENVYAYKRYQWLLKTQTNFYRLGTYWKVNVLIIRYVSVIRFRVCVCVCAHFRRNRLNCEIIVYDDVRRRVHGVDILFMLSNRHVHIMNSIHIHISIRGSQNKVCYYILLH